MQAHNTGANNTGSSKDTTLQTSNKAAPLLAVEKFINAEIDPSPVPTNVKAEKDTYTATDLFNLNASEIPCLVDNIIPATGIWTIVGASDTGKSMLYRQLALDIVKGKSFLGMAVKAKLKKVLFIATEDDAISTSYLLRKQSPTIECLDNIRFYFDTDNVIEYLNSELTKDPVDLIIIDAWSDVFGQNLNDSALIRQTLNQYRSIANRYSCSIGFLHHTGKRTEKLEPSKNNILSGQGYEAKMRLVIELRNDIGDENIKHLCIVKGNYLSKEYKQESFVLQFDPLTFRFTNTGLRVPFDQLAAPVDQTSKGKKNVPFHEINEDVHGELVKAVFKNNQQFKYKELFESLGNIYAKKTKEVFGRDRSQQLLNYLVNEGFIKKHGPDKASIYEQVLS